MEDTFDEFLQSLDKSQLEEIYQRVLAEIGKRVFSEADEEYRRTLNAQNN